jgi:hypothetical protein
LKKEELKFTAEELELIDIKILVESLNGTFSVDDRTGKGAKFRIFFLGGGDVG